MREVMQLIAKDATLFTLIIVWVFITLGVAYFIFGSLLLGAWDKAFLGLLVFIALVAVTKRCICMFYGE